MKKSTKIMIALALCLIITGGIIFTYAMSSIGWDFTKLSTVSYVDVTYDVNESITEVSVTLDTADVTILPSEDGFCKVECYTEKDSPITARVENGCLIIEKNYSKAWYDYVGINFEGETVTVYLPETICAELNVKVSTGDVTLSRVISEEKMTIKTSTGDVMLEACDSAEILIKTGTGDVTASLLSPKSFDTTTSTGDVSVPESADGGKCTVTTSTGDIKIEIKK